MQSGSNRHGEARHIKGTKIGKGFPTTKQLRDLGNRLASAYKEACMNGSCDCVTNEEHERMLES